MSLVMTAISNPRLLGSGQIELTVEFSDGVTRPFVACPNDCVEHGRELHARALREEFGVVVPYVPPTQSEVEAQSAACVRADRDQLLKASDWTQLPDVPELTRALWAEYRQALRDVSKQQGFPLNVVWPAAPT